MDLRVLRVQILFFTLFPNLRALPVEISAPFSLMCGELLWYNVSFEHGEETLRKMARRTPLRYDGTESTSHQIGSILGSVLKEIGKVSRERGDLVLASWPEVIGKQLLPMTQAISFRDGVLYVKVKNSTLFSLLNVHDKPRVLKNLRDKFPGTTIHNIVFQIG